MTVKELREELEDMQDDMPVHGLLLDGGTYHRFEVSSVDYDSWEAGYETRVDLRLGRRW